MAATLRTPLNFRGTAMLTPSRISAVTGTKPSPEAIAQVDTLKFQGKRTDC